MLKYRSVLRITNRLLSSSVLRPPNSVVFSGIQPSGKVTIGNYLGAIRHWVDLQNDPERQCFFCVADLHSLTTDVGRQQLDSRHLFATLVACGIDVERSCLFVQSHNVFHAQLMWVLSSFIKLHQLRGVTQWRTKHSDQSGKTLTTDDGRLDDEMLQCSTGLFIYPILQAADILLYDADFVPIGRDQEQHLRLTRSIASDFNRRCGKRLFKKPKALIDDRLAKIYSLRRPTVKMSKSDVDQRSSLFLSDDDDIIAQKIRASVTDSIDGVSYQPADRPGVSNLLSIVAGCTRQSCDDEEFLNQFQGMDKRTFKEKVTEIVIETIRPIRRNVDTLLSGDNRGQVDEWMKIGQQHSTLVASKKWSAVTQLLRL